MSAQGKRIFISYRRDDTAPYAGWLHDRLAQQYGASRVFKDVDSIRPGSDFPRIIAQAVASCDVLLAIIGPGWAGTDAVGQPRVNDPGDWIRLEVEAALDQGIRIIPLLIGDAHMPSEELLPPSLGRLHQKQFIRISYESFSEDVRRLVSVIDFSEPSPFDTDQAKRIERSRTDRFAELDRLYRAKVGTDQLIHRYDPFMKTSFRRRQLDALTDALDFDEEVVSLALGTLTDQSAGIKEEVIKGDWARGLAALTQRRLVYASIKPGAAPKYIPYAHVLAVDAGMLLSSITFTLSDRNLQLGWIKPRARTAEFLAYLRDRIPPR